MHQDVHRIRRVLRSTALCSVTALLLVPAFAQAYDPNAGSDDTTSKRSSSNKASGAFDPNAGSEPARTTATRLPSTDALIDPKPKSFTLPSTSTASSEAPNFAPVVALSPMAAMAAPMANAPQPTIAAEAPITYAQPAASAAAPVASAAPAAGVASMALPPVDPAVEQQAKAELAAQQAQAVTPQRGVIAAPPNFTAPAPLVAQTPVAAAPVAAPEPVVAATPVAVAPVAIVAPTPVAQPAVAPLQPLPNIAPAPTPAPVIPVEPGLSDSSRTALHKLPKLSTAKPIPAGKLEMERMSPAVKPLATDKKVESYDAVGLSIKVARPGIDPNFELNKAYTALMGGDTATAIATYKGVLDNDPQNQDALFGLASTYHRNNELDKARPYYTKLLQVNPNHREGLNNFLALVSDESPNEALAELERLEQKNPDFSPIPAQEAIVLSKLGYFDQAKDKMLRAIELAPENFTYKYNLAVMFDRHGDYPDAAALYRLLVDASISGEKLPASTETLQKRLNYISAAMTRATNTGN